MLIDDAIHETRHLQASLRSMRVEETAMNEASVLCRALEHDPIDNVLEFTLDALSASTLNCREAYWLGWLGCGSRT